MNLSDLFGVEGKVVVVTGGSRGIGEMIARGFASNGARVYISSRDAAACAKVAGELSRDGECIALPADLSTVGGVEALASELASREGALHVLVNNAGAAWGAPLEEFPEIGFDKVWNLNVKGLFFLTVKLLPLLRKAARSDDPARVINIGSIDGIRVPRLFQNYSYSAAKAGVHMLTRHLAYELLGDHITVNAIAPGLFRSKMTKTVFEHAEDAALDHIPMRRAGRPEDMAGTAIFLSSKAGAYLTGAVIPVDGGVSTTA
jgi:NAD(P)-dependent dehydrogenase (short-subunit alcohol dehydrogenase family)